jgi:ketosteroid isomerase-like protein
MSRGFTVGIALIGFACASPRQESPPPDSSAIRTDLDSLWARYTAAAVAGDGDAIAQLYADNAYVVESGLATIRGKDALRSVVKEVLGGVRFIEASITPELTEVTGDRVLQFGSYRDVLQQGGQPVQVVVGRFSAVLHRDSTGSWRVRSLIAVADSTVPLAVKQK